MTDSPLNTAGVATVAANGIATVVLGPGVGQRWLIKTAAVSTSTSVLVPLCKLYVGGGITPLENNLIDGTYSGNLDSTDLAEFPISNGQKIIAQWTGADVGAKATLSIFGIVRT